AGKHDAHVEPTVDGHREVDDAVSIDERGHRRHLRLVIAVAPDPGQVLFDALVEYFALVRRALRESQLTEELRHRHARRSGDAQVADHGPWSRIDREDQ